jgi:DNA-binding transcriptional MerR regulator
MEERVFRVGELSRLTGLTVRTLHHWEAEGILRPTRRTPSGHRLYGPDAIQTLQRIRSLKALGLQLGEIRETLATGAASLEAVLQAQRDRIREQLARLVALDERLGQALLLLRDRRDVPQEELLGIMEAMTAIERHFSSEQLEYLRDRAQSIGPDTIRAAQEEWPILIREMTEAMSEGEDPASPRVQALVARWEALIEAFTGGDPEVEAALARMYRAEPGLAEGQGLHEELFSFVAQASGRAGG